MAAADDPSHGSAGARTGEVILLAALAAATLAALLSVDYLPTNDGPRHIFAIHAANHLDEPGTGYGLFFEPSYPVTSLGFQTIFGPLERWLPWRTALQLALGAMLLLWTFAAHAFARAVHPGRGWLGLALAAGAFQWSLYMGLFSFYIATATGLFVLAVAFGPSPWTGRRRAVLCALLASSFLLSLRLPFYAQTRASYLLSAIVPIALKAITMAVFHEPRGRSTRAPSTIKASMLRPRWSGNSGAAWIRLAVTTRHRSPSRRLSTVPMSPAVPASVLMPCRCHTHSGMIPAQGSGIQGLG